jgi:16S rRNA (cytosine967-C5)-methyltransferase
MAAIRTQRIAFFCTVMKRYHSYHHSAAEVLASYKGTEPFSAFIKKYFSRDKKFGSTDRKQISHLCYCYFRLGKSALKIPLEKGIVTGLFLCSTSNNEMLAALAPAWNEMVSLPLEEKIRAIAGETGHSVSTDDIFPWRDKLSAGIDFSRFCTSFLVQPDLFLRVRPHHAEEVMKKLSSAGVDFELMEPFAIRLPNSFKADLFFEIDKQVVIQDFNSQQTAQLLLLDQHQPPEVWDCCAASGGKSILAYDLNPSIRLTVSDIRESILENLERRFKRAGIKQYRSSVLDLSGTSPFEGGNTVAEGSMDLVICDAPCTGSGTWSRTPEQLCYFEENKIAGYAGLQKNIVKNIVSRIKPGGMLLYITCSVFTMENEDAVAFMVDELGLERKRMELFKGYDKRADTLFAALLGKPL